MKSFLHRFISGTFGLLVATALVAEAPRLIVLSDFPPLDVIPGGGGGGPPEKLSDPDDIQSMVRLLLYSNDIEIEGLIASAGTHANVANKQNIMDLLDLYAQVEGNLVQHDDRYPTADTLRARVWQGRSGSWGKPVDQIVGEGKDTEASEAIIRIVDRPDPRPVWVGVWGGPCEVAQAIWKVRQTRSPAELQRFLGKLRIFMIGLGNKPGQDGSGQWLLDTFPHLFMIVSQETYHGMFAGSSPVGNLTWLNAHIRRDHGPLGAAYPRSGYYPDSPGVQEGDTPTFLHLASAVRGLNHPEHPDQGGWGGQYVQRDTATNHWFDGPGPESIRQWLPEIQADFAARANWMLPGSTAEGALLKKETNLLEQKPAGFVSPEARAAAAAGLFNQTAAGVWPKDTARPALATYAAISEVLKSRKPNRRLLDDPAYFLKIEAHRPLYADRDTQPLYLYAEVGDDRRRGCAYHGASPAALLAKDHPALRARLAA